EGYGIWQIIAGKDLQGFLVVKIMKNDIDVFVQMAIDQSINMYAIQFIKEKIVLDTKEQIKDSFINQLLVEKIEDKERIIQYSSMFNFNIHEPHKIGIISLEFLESSYENVDFLTIETQKTLVWDRIREKILSTYPDVLVTRKDSYFVLFVAETRFI